MPEEQPTGHLKVDLSGQTAIVTGASQGIGRAIAFSLGAAGANVACIARNAEKLADTVKVITDAGGTADAFSCDVTQGESVTKVVAEVVEKWGKLDVLVNNAGITRQLGFFDVTPDDWDRINSVNTRGLFFCMQAAATRMREQDSGTIVNIASIAGKGYRGTSNIAYAGTKGCVLALTRVGAHQLARYGITVNSLCPGVTRTTLFNQVTSEAAERTGRPLEDIIARAEKEIPIRRSNTPDDIAHAAVFLGSNAARNITGQSLNVDGGLIFD